MGRESAPRRRLRAPFGLVVAGTIAVMVAALVLGSGVAASAHETKPKGHLTILGIDLGGLLNLHLGDHHPGKDPGGVEGCLDHDKPPYVGDGDGDGDDIPPSPCPTPTRTVTPSPSPTGEHHHHHHHHHDD
jgi:hypothetical protein